VKTEVLYIWFQQAIGIYSRLAVDIYARFVSITEIYNCNDFSFLGEDKAKYIKRLRDKDTTSAFEVMKRCESLGVRVTGYYDEFYPARLKNINSPPAVLYSIGNIRNLNDVPCIAIVGTRKMSDYGRETAEKFAYTFAKSGVCVVSGLAKGVDTAAHRGAIMADGFTVAVLGNPIGEIYPRENEKAFETLYQRGLVVSELYPGAPRTRADFPNRNRIISGMCDAVVIAEAGEHSGALITARHAISQGKQLYAVPGAIGAENAGTNALIKTGVPVATEPHDVLSPLALAYPKTLHPYEPAVTEKLRSYGNVVKTKTIQTDKVNKAEIPKPTETVKQEDIKNIEPVNEPAPFVEEEKFAGNDAERIFKLLKGANPLTADEISARLNIPVSDVMIELTLMEIDGSIISSTGGRYISSKF